VSRTALWLLAGLIFSSMGLWLLVTSAADSLSWLFGLWIALHGLGALLVGGWQRLHR